MPRELTIRPVLNGWIIQCGCQTVVHNDPNVIIAEFASWVHDPAKMEAKYEKLRREKGDSDEPAPNGNIAPQAMTPGDAITERTYPPPPPPPAPAADPVHHYTALRR